MAGETSVGNLGFQELLVVGVIALLVIGPDRLPELARQAAKAIARLRQEAASGIDELKRAADLEDLGRELSGLRRELGDAGRSVSRSVTRSVAAADRPRTAEVRPDDRPPPTDPDAT